MTKHYSQTDLQIHGFSHVYIFVIKFQVSAENSDGNDEGIVYSLKPSTDNVLDIFTIDASSGNITVQNGNTDREDINEYVLVVEAQDRRLDPIRYCIYFFFTWKKNTLWKVTYLLWQPCKTAFICKHNNCRLLIEKERMTDRQKDRQTDRHRQTKKQIDLKLFTDTYLPNLFRSIQSVPAGQLYCFIYSLAKKRTETIHVNLISYNVTNTLI